MKYSINKVKVDLPIHQKTINDSEIDFHHSDPIDVKAEWYKKGYTRLHMPADFLKNIETRTKEYISTCAKDALAVELSSLTGYHRQIVSDEQHIKVIHRMGKLIPPKRLGIDVKALGEQIKQACHIDYEISCRDMCDLRVFRPYAGKTMDNNPLHRDTWLPALNHCINVYIPVAGNTRLSSISLIPGSHLWDRADIERTASNALIAGIQYGLPSVAGIKKKFRVIRPMLHKNEVLLFSSNMIHGGAINLNKNSTRVSIEIRFWPKHLATGG